MKCELKKVKINQRLSEETTCYSADLYIDGKKAADCSNRGCGGPDEIRWLSSELEEKFKAMLATMPPFEAYGVTITPSTDTYIGELLDAHETKVQLRRWCAKAVLFRLVGDEAGQYRTLEKTKYSPAVAKHLRDKYGDKLEVIVNETLS